MNQELRNKLIEWSKSRDDIDLVVVFGSRAHERNRPDSDLDLAIWRSCAWKTDFVRECMDELTEILPTTIDLVDLSNADGPILQEILCNGQKIFERHDHLLGELYIRLMDWRTDFAPAWEKMVDQRRKRWLAKNRIKLISK